MLWKAINASPEEILRDAQKMAVLEAESKGLREEEVRNNAVISELNAPSGKCDAIFISTKELIC